MWNTSRLSSSHSQTLSLVVMSLKHIAMSRRQKRLSVNRFSIKDKVLFIPERHVICSDVTSIWVAWRSRRMCCKFLRTAQKVSSALRSDVLVQFHVMPTCTSIKPANNLQIDGNSRLHELHTAIIIYKKDSLLTNC